MNPAQQIEKWIKDAKLKRDADKKQNSSSKYNKLEASPEDISVFADVLAKQNGTTPEEEAGKIQAAIDRDNAIEEATFAQNHPIMNMQNEGGLVTGGGMPQTNVNVNKTVSAAATPDAKVEEEMKKAEAAQAQIDGTDGTITETVSEAVTPKKGDTEEETAAKGKYNKSMMSIWDAYRNGDIDKETAGYFTIDAIATLAKNLGRSIGNVGAQFSGGTIDNGHDTSMWEQRRDSMFNTELQKETEGIDTFENKFKQLSYDRSSTINDLLEAVKSDADKLSDDNPLKIAYLSLAAMIGSGQVDGTTTLAATGAKGITELFNLFKRKDKESK